MTLFTKPTAVAFVLCAALALGGQAHAQSTQGMDLLTPEERQDFNRRLQYSAASSERAKITSEMNRLVRERALAKRRAESKAGKDDQPGDANQ